MRDKRKIIISILLSLSILMCLPMSIASANRYYHKSYRNRTTILRKHRQHQYIKALNNTLLPSTYTYYPAHFHIKILKAHQPIYQFPNTQAIMQSSFNNNRPKIVHIDTVAKAYHQHEYLRISFRHKSLGWVRWSELSRPAKYVLPFTYTSQFWPSRVSDACEAAALKMGLSSLGKAKHEKLKQIVDKIPRTSNPNYGYIKDPYEYGSGATIYPWELEKVARKYGVKGKVIDNAPVSKFKTEIKNGNPIIFEGSYLMHNTSSDHSLILVGYKRNAFLFADPLSFTRNSPRVGWVSIHQFKKVFYSPRRQQKAVVLFY